MATLHFGVLMVPYQTLDAVGPLDIVSSCSKPYIESLEKFGIPGTAGVSAKAQDIQFHHINETMDPVALTAGIKILPTTTCDDCPPLDYLLVGGPDVTTYQIPERFAQFIRDHVAAGKELFTTCTGAIAVSPSGVLDGKNATTNHMCLPLAKIHAPNVQWVRKQWVIDGNIWTAGGASAGMDMMAHWAAEKFGLEVTGLALELLDFDPRGLDGALVELRSRIAETF